MVDSCVQQQVYLTFKMVYDNKEMSRKPSKFLEKLPVFGIFLTKSLICFEQTQQGFKKHTHLKSLCIKTQSAELKSHAVDRYFLDTAFLQVIFVYMHDLYIFDISKIPNLFSIVSNHPLIIYHTN